MTDKPDECKPVCGNNILTPPEQCDDGNLDNNDLCNSTCFFICGNGKRDTASSETCDDGTPDLIGCSSNCKGVVATWSCGGGTTTWPDKCIKTCTQATSFFTTNYDKICDDENNRKGDGCSDSCLIENGWTCEKIEGAIHDTCIRILSSPLQGSI